MQLTHMLVGFGAMEMPHRQHSLQQAMWRRCGLLAAAPAVCCRSCQEMLPATAHAASIVQLNILPPHPSAATSGTYTWP